jgi:uncharacterized protein (TIGR00297 family)
MAKTMIGALINIVFSFVAYKKKSLSLSGFAAAAILGTAIYTFGGIFFWIILGSFFVSSSILTKIKDYISVADEVNLKDGIRTYTQVIANGFAGLLFAYLFYLTKDHLYMLAFAASIASCNADTWASEIGRLSTKETYSLLTRNPIEKGLSGGVSNLGLLASFLGSLFIAIIFLFGYLIIYDFSREIVIFFVLCVAAGFWGSILDSIIGETIQAKYYCSVCGKVIEKNTHHRTSATLIKGVVLIDNNVVNLLSPLLAATTVIIIYLL